MSEKFYTKKFLALAPLVLPPFLIIPYLFIASEFRGIIWAWETVYIPFWFMLGVLLVLAVTASFFLWHLQDVGVMIFETGCVLALLHNAYVAMSERRHSILILVFALFVSGILLAFHLRKVLKLPYYDSRRRWWESYPKGIPGLSAELISSEGNVIPVRLSNFGHQGCFVFSKGDRIVFQPKSVRIISNNRVLFEADVEIIEKTGDAFGVGLRFCHQDQEGDWSKDLQDHLSFLRRSGYEISQ